MDRLLVAEFPTMFLEDDPVLAAGNWKLRDSADIRPLVGYNNQYWVSEVKLDLSGYTMKDETVYFRNSFEQSAGSTYVNWEVDDPSNPLLPDQSNILEAVILTTVPMTDDNLAQVIFNAPGFIPANFQLGKSGNFNRTQIIHGTTIAWGIDTTFGADSFNASGLGFCRIVQQQDFSSLEPTAAENIYCYRVVYLPQAYDRTVERGLDIAYFPAKRVILNCMIDKEPDIEYLMRLKRSYELANQV